MKILAHQLWLQLPIFRKSSTGRSCGVLNSCFLTSFLREKASKGRCVSALLVSMLQKLIGTPYLGLRKVSQQQMLLPQARMQDDELSCLRLTKYGLIRLLPRWIAGVLYRGLEHR